MKNNITAQDAKTITNFHQEIGSCKTEWKASHALKGIEKEIFWAASEGRSYIIWAYAVEEVKLLYKAELEQRGFKVDYVKDRISYLMISW